MPIAKEILDMLDIGRKPSQVISVVFFTSKIEKIAKDKCSHCAIGLDVSFRWLSLAPSHRIIALWVNPLRQPILKCRPIDFKSRWPS